MPCDRWTNAAGPSDTPLTIWRRFALHCFAIIRLEFRHPKGVLAAVRVAGIVVLCAGLVLLSAGCKHPQARITALPPVKPPVTALDLAQEPPKHESPTIASSPSSSELGALATLGTELDYESWIGLDAWAKALRLPNPILTMEGTNCIAKVKLPTGTLELRLGRHHARWENTVLWLCYAPTLIRGRCSIHGRDIKDTLWPILTDNGLPLATNSVIVIDPGHGGANPGARNVVTGHWEKEYTLDWALRLKRILENLGWHVYLTRTNDTDLALEARAAIADAVDAGLFLSLHFNDSNGKPAESGIETYCLTPSGLPSAVTRSANEQMTVSYPNNVHDTENIRAAFRVHRALVARTGAVDRGVRRARFMTVLRNQRRPAILIEGGYLSNPHEARMIARPAYREALAMAVAEAIGSPPPLPLVSP